MPSPGHRSIIVNATFLGGAQLATNIARIIYAIALARLLGAELYGYYNYGLSWYLLFLPISALGINWVLSREIGSDPSAAPRLIAHTFAIRVTSALAVFVISALLAVYLETNSDVRFLLIIFSFALLGRSLSVWLQSVFVAKESAKYVLLQTLIFRLGEVIGGIGLLLFGFGLVALASFHAGIWIAQSIFSSILLRRLIGRIKLDLRRQEIVRILRRGFPFLVASIFISWLLQGPMLLFRHVDGLGEELGFLGLALQAFTILAMLLSQLGAAALPVLSRSIDRQDGKSDYFVQEVLRLGWFVGGVLVMSALSLGPPLIELVVGPQYRPVASILPWSLLLVMFYFWTTSFQGIVGVHGHFGWVIASNAIGAGVFTSGFVMLVPAWSAQGAIVAMGAGIATVALGHLLILRRYHRLHWKKKFFKPALSSVAGVGICWISLGAGNWAALFLGLLTMVGVSFALGAISREDFRLLFRR